MTLLEAIKTRHSVRSYIDRPLCAEHLAALQQKVDALNAEGYLHMQLVTNEPNAFGKSMLAKYGKFSNVTNYVMVVGEKADNLDERVGYYGEALVLFAQTLGLNTCWVGLTYSKKNSTITLAPNEKIACCIALGYGATQGAGHPKRKTVEQVSNASTDTPAWFNAGVEAALLAPTAVHQQKFFLTYCGTNAAGKGLVKGSRRLSLVGYTKIDLGIVKQHFELAAGKEHFEWV